MIPKGMYKPTGPKCTEDCSVCKKKIIRDTQGELDAAMELHMKGHQTEKEPQMAEATKTAKADKFAEIREPKRHELLEIFDREYGVAIGNTRKSARLTDTDRWQGIYKDFQAGVQDTRQEIAMRLRQMASRFDDKLPIPDDTKTLGGIKGEVEELIDQHGTFMRATVFPVQRCVEDCHRLIGSMRQKANALKIAEPLYCETLPADAQAAVDAVAKANWDGEAGRVWIVEATGETA